MSTNYSRQATSPDDFRTKLTARLAKRQTDSTNKEEPKPVCTAVAVASPEFCEPLPIIAKELTGPGVAPSSGDAHPSLNGTTRRPLSVDLSQPGLLRLRDVLTIYRVSRSTWYAGIKSGLYQPGTPIGPRCVAWRSEYIRDLIANPPKFVRT